jgi:hypothetical protein
LLEESNIVAGSNASERDIANIFYRGCGLHPESSSLSAVVEEEIKVNCVSLFVAMSPAMSPATSLVTSPLQFTLILKHTELPQPPKTTPASVDPISKQSTGDLVSTAVPKDSVKETEQTKTINQKSNEEELTMDEENSPKPAQKNAEKVD